MTSGVSSRRHRKDANLPSSPLLESEREIGSAASPAGDPNLDASRPGPTSLVLGTGYSSNFFIALISEFDRAVYPLNPMVTSAEIHAAIRNMHESPEDAALVYAFAGVTMSLSTTSWASHNHSAGRMADLIQRSFHSLRQVDSESGGIIAELPVSVKRATTCLFLGITLMAFKRFDRSFAMLREAIALVHTFDNYSCNAFRLSAFEAARRRRIYLGMYMHERFLTMVSGYPSVLPTLATAALVADSCIQPHIDTGFNCLVRLFYILDDTFLAHWTEQTYPTQIAPEITAQWIQSKQAQLDQDEISTAEAKQSLQGSGRGMLTELQHANLSTTRLWLRTLVWQLALSRGILSSATARDRHEGLSLHLPAHRLSGQLGGLVNQLDSFASIGTHGNGMLRKLFEITSTIADVLALPATNDQTQSGATAQAEDLLFSVRFPFGRVEKWEKEHLLEKLRVLQRIYTDVFFGDLVPASSDG
ncbi:hypothetical protein MRS44_013029 [Fusarium solani]|uniref:uncharacterized protein n=1 Tax=Fusarium solani TaxID=169388 RepID=UPI0032C44544|nr:hypothetical protein MRS44_013029 [Fusarium solani]